MANHFVSINRGKTGNKLSDFTEDTSSTAADDIEIRLADAAGLTKKDVYLALEAFKRFFSGRLGSDFPKL